MLIESCRGHHSNLFVYEPNSFVPLATVQGTTEQANTYWYQCDQVGVPQELTDRQGNIVWAADYKAWGEAKVRDLATGTDGPQTNSRGPRPIWHGWEDTGDHTGYLRGERGSNGNEADKNQEPPQPVEQPFRLQGQQVDEETGLHYNRYRYYDPEIGRFVSEDPIGLRGGLNLFTFSPNAFDWVDPFGLLKAKFRQNSNGTMKSASAHVTKDDIGKGTSTNQSSRDLARGFGCQDDDAGHAIGKNLGGDGDGDGDGDGGVNGVFPQTPNINRGEFRGFEQSIARAVQAGDNVIVRVVPQYAGGATRPHEVLYQVRINGKTMSTTFDNPYCC